MIMNDQARMQRLREQAKAQLSQAPGPVGELSQEELRDLVHDYQVNQIVLGLQNEELRMVLQQLQETKDRLALARDRHSRLFENAPVGYLVVDENEMIVQANETFANMVGQEAQRLQGVSFTDFIDPEDHGVFHGRYRAFFKHPGGKKLEFRLLGKNGSLHAHCTAGVEEEPPATEEGEPLKRILLVVQDVSARVQAEKALRDSEQQYLELHEHAPVGIFESTPDGRYLALNPEYARMAGYRSSQAMMAGISNIACQLYLHPEHRDHFNQLLKRDGHARNFETELKRPDGTTFWVSMDARTKRNEQGEISYVGFLTDITERKQAEEALRESEARFRNLFAHLPTVAVQGYGMDGVTRFWNKASEIFYGYSAEEALGGNLLDLIIPDEMRQCVTQEINAMSASCKPVPAAELDLKRKDGSRIHVYSSHAILQVPGKEPEFFCVDVDLTELKQTETALIQAKEHAEAANKAKSEFLANMSHEIRTPLNGIMAMMQLLKTTDLDPDQGMYVEMTLTSVNRLTRLLSDMLDLSRVEAGMVTIDEDEFEVNELGQSVTDLFTHMAREKRLDLHIDIDPAIPAKLIGDEARVRQILFNLVGNALKFTDNGAVHLRISSLFAAKEGDIRLMLSIMDTGIGIPACKMDGLFKPFVQVEGSYTRSYQGAGLGLAIVRRLVEMLGGNISMESTEGQGTTVHVVLPFKLAGRGEKACAAAPAGTRMED